MFYSRLLSCEALHGIIRLLGNSKLYIFVLPDIRNSNFLTESVEYFIICLLNGFQQSS